MSSYVFSFYSNPMILDSGVSQLEQKCEWRLFASLANNAIQQESHEYKVLSNLWTFL